MTIERQLSITDGETDASRLSNNVGFGGFYTSVRETPVTRIFVGNENEVEVAVMTQGSGLGMILTDGGDTALLRETVSSGAHRFELVGPESQHPTCEIRVHECTLIEGTDLGRPTITEARACKPLRLQTNQAYGFGVNQTIDGTQVFAVEATSGQPSKKLTLTPQGEWESTELADNDRAWSNVQVIASTNPTMTTAVIQKRQMELDLLHQAQPMGLEGVFNLVREVTGDTAPPPKKEFRIMQESARRLSVSMPGLVEATSAQLVDELAMATEPLKVVDVKKQLSRSEGVLDEKGLQIILSRLALLPAQHADFAKYIVKDFIPQMVCFTDVATQGKYPDNHADALRNFILRAIDSVATGRFDVATILCPSYNYEMYGKRLDKDTAIRHQDGQMLPSLGERAPHSLQATSRVLNGLAEFLPEGGVTYSVYAYSGEDGVDGLFELGQDVLDHYAQLPDGNATLCSNIASSFDQLNKVISDVFSATRVKAEVVSIESSLVPVIARMYTSFKRAFPDVVELDKGSSDYARMQSWIEQNLGVHMDWLAYYYKQEADYRRKQQVDDTKDQPVDARPPVLDSALREGLVYLATQRIASLPGRAVWGLETTNNYMTGSIDHAMKTMGPVAVAMAKPFNPAQPDKSWGLREPFNMPKNNVGVVDDN